MLLIHETAKHFYVTCERCNKENRVLKQSCQSDNLGYKSNAIVMCSCGEASTIIKKPKHKEFFDHELTTGRETTPIDEPSLLRCKSCGSTQLTGGKKGFSVGKAAVGGVILGPVGLLGGALGSNKVLVTCMNCGNKWEAGKQ